MLMEATIVSLQCSLSHPASFTCGIASGEAHQELWFAVELIKGIHLGCQVSIDSFGIN
jgi:hypothetical protein